MSRETNNALLDNAWDEIEKAIASLGAVIRNDPINADTLHRYEAYKTALSIIADNYANQVYYDRKRPECMPSFSSIFNYVGPSPDFTYHLIHLEPGQSYRMWGKRGDAAVIDLQQLIGWYGENKEKRSTVTVANELFDVQNIKIDGQGNFDFILSPVRQGDQWWKLDERVNTIFIREYFTDFGKQEASSIFHVDRISPDSGKTLIGAEEAAKRMSALATSLNDFTFNFSMVKLYDRVGKNIYEEILFGKDAGVTDQRYFQAGFDIKLNEALVAKWSVPKEYLYWGIALYNDSYQMLNFGNRQVNLNPGSAKVGKDGSLYYVISHVDPGVANWLDTDGHEQGMVTIRTKGGSDFATPTLQLVPLADVLQHLPADVARVTPEQRTLELEIRRRHFQLRERR